MKEKAKNVIKGVLLGGAGGGVLAGAKMLIEPSLMKQTSDIPKKWWIVPAIGIVGAGVLSAFGKTQPVGAGMAGGAIALGIENANLAISVKRNQPTQPAPAVSAAPQTQGLYDTGAYVQPQMLAAGTNTGAWDDTGALVNPSTNYKTIG